MDEKTHKEDNARLRQVRRKLFQDYSDDDEQQKCKDIDNRFSEERRIQLEQNMKKWNFDFVHGKPLPGRYEWVKLDKHGNEILAESEEINARTIPHERYAEEAENNAEHSNLMIEGAKESNM